MVVPLVITQEAGKGCAWWLSTPPVLLRNGFQYRGTPDSCVSPPPRSAAAANAKRPTSGRASLTPTERDVVRLVGEGLANKDIATRLFVSPAHRANPPHPRLHQARPHLPRATRPRSNPPPLTESSTYNGRHRPEPEAAAWAKRFSSPRFSPGVRVLFGPGRFGRIRMLPFRRWSSFHPCGRALRRSGRRGHRAGGQSRR